MRKVIYMVLKTIGPLTRYRPVRRLLENIEMLFAAMLGKGGGSGWDSRGQTRALLECSNLPKDPVIFDVGANNGLWATALNSQISGKNPHFTLFECADYCFEGLEKRADAFANSRIIKAAVSDTEGEIEIHVPKTAGSGLASVHARRDTSVKQHKYDVTKVPCITIDAFIERENVEKIDILKIDVEGHEMAVLNGARQAMATHKINTIMFEFGSANVNARHFFRDFWDLLTQSGYKIRRVVPGGASILIDEYKDADEYFRGCSNFIAHR